MQTWIKVRFPLFVLVNYFLLNLTDITLFVLIFAQGFFYYIFYLIFM